MTTIVKEPDLLSLVRNHMEYRLQNTTLWPDAAWLILNLYVESEAGTGNYELVAELESERDADGGATFDISGILEAQLQYYFSPEVNADDMLQVCPQLCKRYYVEYGFRTGIEVLRETIVGGDEISIVTPEGVVETWYQPVDLKRPLQHGRKYKLIINTADVAVAQQVFFRIENYDGTTDDAYLTEIQLYKGQVYAVFDPRNLPWFSDFQLLNFHQLVAPTGVQVQIYTDFTLMAAGAEKYALLGGLQHTQYPERAALLPGVNRKLLSTLPATINAVDLQHLYLYYLPNVTGPLELQVVTRWSDGTEATATTQLGNVTAYVPYRLAFQLKDILLPGFSFAREWSQCRILLNDEQLVIDRFEPNSDYVTELYYANSLGGYDTLPCTGKGSKELEVLRETASRFLPEDYRPEQGTEYVYRTRGQLSQSLATGPLTKPEMLAHLGILTSRDVKIRIGEKVMPVLVTSKKVQFHRDGDYRYVFEFEVQHAYSSSESLAL